MIKVLSFDLDGTLVSAGFGDMVWNHGIPYEYSKKYSIPFEEARALITNEYLSVGDANIIWYEIEYWLKKFDLAVTPDELLDRYESYIETLPGTHETLEVLKDKYTLVIASNAARIFVEKELMHTGLFQYFSHVVSATTDYGMVKKEASFYRRLCKMLAVSTDEIIHIGDNLTFDFETPSGIGIEAYYFIPQEADDSENIRRAYNGKTISKIKEVLEKL